MPLVWNAPARYRLGTIGGVENFVGLAYACAVVWAADSSKRWRSPEDLAEHLEKLGVEQINATVSALLTPVADDQKKSS